MIPDTASTYSVDIEGLSGSFVVEELVIVSAEENKTAMPAPAAVTPALAPSPEPEPTPWQIKWWAIIGIFIVIAVAGYFIFFIRKKKEME